MFRINWNKFTHHLKILLASSLKTTDLTACLRITFQILSIKRIFLILIPKKIFLGNLASKMLKACFLLSRNRCRTTNKSMNSFSPYRSYKKFSTIIKQFTRMRKLLTILSKWSWSFLLSVRTKAASLNLLKQHSQISFTKNSL